MPLYEDAVRPLLFRLDPERPRGLVDDAIGAIELGRAGRAVLQAAYANLRGLNPTFGTRTLTLVNTRRFVPTSDGGQVDLNLIPFLLNFSQSSRKVIRGEVPG